MLLPLAGITPESIVDGPGIRLTLFFQGCPHHCLGCHNEETQPFNGGTPTKVEEILEAIRKNPNLDGVTFSGGEPFAHLESLWNLIQVLQENFPLLSLGAYSGYTFEELVQKKNLLIDNILSALDFLVDGLFILAQKKELPFRGSSNQRFLFLKEGKIR